MLKKADVTNKDCKSQNEEQETSLLLLGPVAADPKGCVTIAIHAKPGSKQHARSEMVVLGWLCCPAPGFPETGEVPGIHTALGDSY
uniref:Uncharacterized protein n=1 Tax=Equus asinus asinus TaxID=83772 RepID=A0A8C4ME26_EQUAS